MKTIAEIHAAFEARKISPTELAQEYLGRVKTEKLGAYLTLTEARALDQATQAQKRLEKEGVEALKKVPLLGIPTGIKDVFAQAGVRTTCASKMLESYVAPYTATAVARLEAAGAVTLGKLNMDEFAMGGSNENSAFGPVQHPTHPGRVPGGSSGGSAAAVKGDLCVVALGTDTGGSVRLPASYCGVVGFKPTYGAVSRFGLVAFASSLDQAGPMANRVEDAARVLEVMSGHDSLDSTSMERPPIAALKASRETPNWKGLRIGVPEEYFGGGLQAEVEGSVRQALRWFESQGARLIPIRLAHTRYAVAAYYLIAVSEASSNLARFDGVRYGTRSAQADAAADLAAFYEASRASFGPEVKRRILLGTYALSSGYYDAYYRRACQVRRLIQKDFVDAFSQCDVIAGPVSATTAFKLGEKSGDPLQMYLNDIFTVPVNLAGVPAMSLPCGKDGQGLPIGLQLIGPAFSDERLFSIAAAYERSVTA